MKAFLLTVLLCGHLVLSAQVKIHAHNDYEKARPLTNALASRAYSIEADVFLRDGKLLVAHHAREIREDRSLDALYILPIVSLFKKYNGCISADKRYRPALMIDVKEGGKEAIALLAGKLAVYAKCFDSLKNPMAVKIIISGDRGKIQEWNSFPSFIFFDGRPYENYDRQSLKRVAVISDSYASYASRRERIDSVLHKSHRLGKPFRFWGTPDDEKHWSLLYEAGVDIINTDKPDICRQFFDGKQHRLAF